jgi:hypothetical protein
MKLIRRFDILAPDRSLYLRRWILWLPFGFRLYLHKMVAPDYAIELHDHPWPFLTLVLRGGYEERYQSTDGVASRWNPPGMVRINRARHTHAVSGLPNGTCWTLVLRGRRWRRWGFWTDCGWQDFEQYLKNAYAGDPVCEDEA